MKQISNTDAVFFYADTPHTPSVVGGVSIYDPSSAPGGKVRFMEILQYMRERLHLWEPFRQKLVRVPMDLDLPYLANDPDFDLEFHVRHIALPKPGDWKQLCILLARIYSRPLDMNRPMWEMYVIGGLDNIDNIPKGSFAVLIKIHHILTDGVSAIALMEAIHELDPEASRDKGTDSFDGTDESLPTDAALLTRALPNLVQQPLTSIGHTSALIRGELKAGRSRRQERLLKSPSVPRTRFNEPVSVHRVFEGREYVLEDIRKFRKAINGATINDAAIAICAGAMRRYLLAKEELPKTSLVAMCPISVRTEGAEGDGGNQISDMAVAMGTDIEDPIARLQAIRIRTQDAKRMAAVRGPDLLSHISGILSPALASATFRRAEGMKWISKMRPICNTFVSNVPGLPMDIFFAGAKLVAGYGMAPLGDGMGIFHAVTSHKNTLTISITACREHLPDPDFYAECIDQSYNELRKAAFAKLKTAK